jgi:CysZ protein
MTARTIERPTTLSSKPNWIPLPSSAFFLLSKRRLFGLSLLLFIVTLLITWGCYIGSVTLIDNLTGDFFLEPPSAETIWGWIKHKGWIALKWLFLVFTRIIAFYLAFLTAYTITTPGYSILSTATEKLHAGDEFEMDDLSSWKGLFIDLIEGIKIGAFGIVVTILAIIVNFIPGIGQILAFLLYTYYSALMFVDYPTSRRHWTLGQKIGWLKTFKVRAFRLGLLPALISMIPILNIFFIALLFPLLTVHATLNFTAINNAPQKTL